MDLKKVKYYTDENSVERVLVLIKSGDNNIFEGNCVNGKFDTEKCYGTTVLLDGLSLEVAREIEVDTISFLARCATSDPSPGVVEFEEGSVFLYTGQVSPRRVVGHTITEYTPNTGK